PCRRGLPLLRPGAPDRLSGVPLACRPFRRTGSGRAGPDADTQLFAVSPWIGLLSVDGQRGPFGLVPARARRLARDVEIFGCTDHRGASNGRRWAVVRAADEEYS